jgi:hypothetical protein
MAIKIGDCCALVFPATAAARTMISIPVIIRMPAMKLPTRDRPMPPDHQLPLAKQGEPNAGDDAAEHVEHQKKALRISSFGIP